ncbi:hypothetical protein NN561_020024 [Cricetulus griseus]
MVISAKYLYFSDLAVIFANGERWKALWRFSVATMRDFGMGKRSVEEWIQEEAQYLVDELRNCQGLVFSSGERAKQLRRFSIATLRDFGMGKRGVEERILEEAGYLLEALQKTNVMKRLPGPQQQAYKGLKALEDFIAKKVEQHQSTLDPNSPRDFIDSFLIRMQEEKDPNTEFFMKNLVLTTLNLFAAGTETISTTLRYGFLLLMKHPDVEAKVHEEIDRVIGRNRQPKYEDRTKMPYTEAVIHEIQRFGDVIPMGVPRRVTKDTKFRDFLIPKVLTHVVYNDRQPSPGACRPSSSLFPLISPGSGGFCYQPLFPPV